MEVGHEIQMYKSSRFDKEKPIKLKRDHNYKLNIRFNTGRR